MEDKKQVLAGVTMFMIALFILVCVHWIVEMKLMDTQGDSLMPQAMFYIYNKFKDKILVLRFAFVVCLWGFYYVNTWHKVNKNETPESMMWWRIYGLMVSLLMVVGTINLYYYDLLIYPVLLFLGFLFIGKAASPFRKSQNSTTGVGISQKEENDMSFTIGTDQGPLVIHAPQQGIAVEGGAGSGKSASCVEPILEQAVWKDFSGVVYDFKGNPPTLGKTVYSAMLRRKQQGKEGKVKLALLNFMDLTRSVRCNPIDPDYIDSKLFASEIAFTMMVNLQKDWREKQDFWASNAISYVEGIIWMLKKHKPEYCTIPHVVAIGLNSVETVLNYLSTDMEVGMMMKPLMDAFKNKAANQIAGVSASAQLPIKKLFTPEIFWVLSKPDISLDVNNIENPIMLCVANDPQLQEALGAAIAVVLTTCFKNMNQQGKQKSIIAIDELPTIYINKLDNIPATARSNKVVTLLAYQSYAQLERDYGKQNAEVIIGNLGNQMTGMTNELRTAERIEKTFGQYKVKDYSHSESDSGLSTTESNKLEKVIQAKEILGQKIGHFTGKIAGGEPPFFSAQFDYYDLEKFDIPQSCAIDTGDEKMNKEIMNSLAIENFDRINREAQELLAPFEPQPALD